MRLPSSNVVQEAEGVESSMIATEIGSMLLMALSLVEVVPRIVGVGDERRQVSDAYLPDGSADIVEDVF